MWSATSHGKWSEAARSFLPGAELTRSHRMTMPAGDTRGLRRSQPGQKMFFERLWQYLLFHPDIQARAFKLAQLRKHQRLKEAHLVLWGN